MKLIPSLAAILLLALNTGCVSYLAWDHTAQEMANARSRKAIQLGASPGEAYLAVDITAWDYIRENPGLVLGAALTDGALLYGAYWLTQEVGDQDGRPVQRERHGRGRRSGDGLGQRRRVGERPG